MCPAVSTVNVATACFNIKNLLKILLDSLHADYVTLIHIHALITTYLMLLLCKLLIGHAFAHIWILLATLIDVDLCLSVSLVCSAEPLFTADQDRHIQQRAIDLFEWH